MAAMPEDWIILDLIHRRSVFIGHPNAASVATVFCWASLPYAFGWTPRRTFPSMVQPVWRMVFALIR
jgi:hypothetical protein